MSDFYTEDLSEFGHIQLEEAGKLLSAVKNGLPEDFYDDESNDINFDFEDEVIQSSVLAFEGKIMNERFS